MILDVEAPTIAALRRKLEPAVTAMRGSNTKWQNTIALDVKIEVAKIGTYYATRAPADVDRLLQAVTVQAELIRRTGGGIAPTQGKERLYESFLAFSKDAALCLFGRDGLKKPFAEVEELSTGWAILNHAMHPKAYLVCGRNEDRPHSGILKHSGITSEFFQGGVLHPTRWNPFINDCWVLGGIKAGLPFIAVTDFMTLSRTV
jgi:hypothetical protein